MGPVYEPDMSSFVFGDHTADIWISASGYSAQEVLYKMIEGLYGTISEAYVLESDLGAMDLSFTSTSTEELLVMLLSETLFLIDSVSEVLLRSEFVLIDDPHQSNKVLSVRCRRFKASIVPERQGMEVKAVTRHGTFFGPKEGVWRARVLLDI
jgi:SHS2 domain-containing protein